MYKFVLNDNDWKVNYSLPVTRDPHGNENNLYTFTKDLTLTNIRHARSICNKIHELLGASPISGAYLHHEHPDVI